MKVKIEWREYAEDSTGLWPGFMYGQKWYFLRDLEYDDYFASPTSGLYYHWVKGRHYLVAKIELEYLRPVSGWAMVKKF